MNCTRSNEIRERDLITFNESQIARQKSFIDVRMVLKHVNFESQWQALCIQHICILKFIDKKLPFKGSFLSVNLRRLVLNT